MKSIETSKMSTEDHGFSASDDGKCYLRFVRKSRYYLENSVPILLVEIPLLLAAHVFRNSRKTIHALLLFASLALVVHVVLAILRDRAAQKGIVPPEVPNIPDECSFRVHKALVGDEGAEGLAVRQSRAFYLWTNVGLQLAVLVVLGFVWIRFLTGPADQPMAKTSVWVLSFASLALFVKNGQAIIQGLAV